MRDDLSDYVKWNYLVKEFQAKGVIEVNQILDEEDLILMGLAFDKAAITQPRFLLINRETIDYLVSIIDVPRPTQAGGWVHLHSWTLQVREEDLNE